MSGMEFSGSIDGMKIDLGKLLRGEFPITDIASFGVSVKGKVFGGDLDAALVGGILKLDAGGRIIDAIDTTTPVADRVFFVGVQGGFKIAGGIGVKIRLAPSEPRPPAGVPNARPPPGVPLEPDTRLST